MLLLALDLEPFYCCVGVGSWGSRGEQLRARAHDDLLRSWVTETAGDTSGMANSDPHFSSLRDAVFDY
jgi:hypothetical protein